MKKTSIIASVLTVLMAFTVVSGTAMAQTWDGGEAGNDDDGGDEDQSATGPSDGSDTDDGTDSGDDSTDDSDSTGDSDTEDSDSTGESSQSWDGGESTNNDDGADTDTNTTEDSESWTGENSTNNDDGGDSDTSWDGGDNETSNDDDGGDSDTDWNGGDSTNNDDGGDGETDWNGGDSSNDDDGDETGTSWDGDNATNDDDGDDTDTNDPGENETEETDSSEDSDSSGGDGNNFRFTPSTFEVHRPSIDFQASPTPANAGEAVEVTGTLDYSTSEEVEILLNDQVVAETQKDAQDSFTASFTPETVGNHSLEVRASDASASSQLEVNPTVDVSNIDSEVRYNSPAQVDVCADVATQGMPEVSLLSDGETLESKSEKGNVCFSPSLSDGVHDLTVRAESNGVSDEESTTVTVDSPSPEPTTRQNVSEESGFLASILQPIAQAFALIISAIAQVVPL